MFTVTLEQLRTEGACFDGYNRVVRMLQTQPFTEEDKCLRSYIAFDSGVEIGLADICRNQGVGDALWATRCLDSKVYVRDLRLFAVWCVRRIQHLLTDERSIRVLDVAERFANGDATSEELAEARQAAYVAYSYVAVNRAACYAAYAASDAASRAVNDTERLEQTEMFIKMCEGKAPWQVNQTQNKTEISTGDIVMRERND